MIQIALLLFGVEFVRSKFWFLGLIGIVWGVMGVGVMIDGLDGELYFPLRAFGLLLLLESIVTLSVAASGVGTQRAVLYFKGGICFFVAVLILADKVYSNLLLAIIFGFTYFVIGLLAITSAWVVRFPRWRSALFSSLTSAPAGNCRSKYSASKRSASRCCRRRSTKGPRRNSCPKNSASPTVKLAGNRRS